MAQRRGSLGAGLWAWRGERRSDLMAEEVKEEVGGWG